MKKILISILLFTLTLSVSANAAKIDEIEIESTLINGVTMVPLSDMAEIMNLDFSANDGVYSVNNRLGDIIGLYIKLSFIRGKEDKAFVEYDLYGDNPGKEEITLSEKAVFIDGKLYVPFRDVLEYFDARVYWTPEDGAYAYMESYGREVIVRTDGNVRQVISAPVDFDDITLLDGYFYYIKGGKLIKRDAETSMEEDLGQAGKIHKSGDKLFVMGSGNLSVLDKEKGNRKTLANGVTMVGYTAEDYAWCETQNGTFVYDREGSLIAEIKGEFENSWDYYKDKVYYQDSKGTMYRANTDGTEEEFLIKAALYPKWIDKFIYYTDMAGNYRRFNVETKEDIMVYGLNLEHVITLEGKHVLNFYGEGMNVGMYISNPDGSGMAPYGSKGVIAGAKVQLYKEGIATMNQVDKNPYYITKDGATKLTDDEIKRFCGVHNGFVYYTIE